MTENYWTSEEWRIATARDGAGPKGRRAEGYWKHQNSGTTGQKCCHNAVPVRRDAATKEKE